MAKGQQRSAKEQRKKKSDAKKPELPRYLRGSEPSSGMAKAMAERDLRKK